jgi:hypothetical protein
VKLSLITLSLQVVLVDHRTTLLVAVVLEVIVLHSIVKHLVVEHQARLD